MFGCTNSNTPALTTSHSETHLQYLCLIPQYEPDVDPRDNRNRAEDDEDVGQTLYLGNLLMASN